MNIWLGFAILALVLWGITGVTQKLSTNRISSDRSFLWFCWAMVALSAAVLCLAPPSLGTGRGCRCLLHGGRRTEWAGSMDQLSRS